MKKVQSVGKLGPVKQGDFGLPIRELRQETLDEFGNVIPIAACILVDIPQQPKDES